MRGFVGMKSNIKGFERLAKELQEAKRSKVKIGIINNYTYPTGESILDVGIAHEFGVKKAPRRSFIRMPFEYKRDEMAKQTTVEFVDIVNGKSTTQRSLNRLGMKGQNIVREAFKTGGFGNWAKLSPETIEAKKSSSILIDTGMLVNSISYKVER